MIRKFLLAGTALVALTAGSAMAADLGRPAAAPVYTKAPAVPYTYSWTGFYIGADGGYGWGTSSGTVTTVAGAPLVPYSYSVTGPLAGGFVGGNYQIDRIVVGLEGDWQWANLTGNSGALPTGGAPVTISTTVKDYGSLRGRLGLAFDRFLVFGTGGWAWGNYSTAYAPVGVTNSVNSSNGWAAGGGVEYAFTDNWTAKVEYLYASFQGANCNSGSCSVGNAFVPGLAPATVNFHENVVRAGINYKFGY